MKISLAFYDLNNGIINLDHIKKVNINLNFGVLSCKVCSFNLTVYNLLNVVICVILKNYAKVYEIWGYVLMIVIGLSNNFRWKLNNEC